MIHPSAVVHPNAVLGRGVEIGPYCVVGEHVTVDSGAILLGHVVVNGHTTIGAGCRIYPFASIGMATQDRKARGERSYTRIGARTVIREYVSIHRATGEGHATAVGDDCLLLAHAHVAHNCKIGDGVTMSNMVQLAGHIEVGDFATLGGMAGVHQFVRIGAHTMIGGGAKVLRDVPPYFLVNGDPAQVHGLNIVGLRRAEFSAETRAELKECYKLLYRSGKNLTQAIDAMKAVVATDEGRQLVAFVETKSDRGILK